MSKIKDWKRYPDIVGDVPNIRGLDYGEIKEAWIQRETGDIVYIAYVELYTSTFERTNVAIFAFDMEFYGYKIDHGSRQEVRKSAIKFMRERPY